MQVFQRERMNGHYGVVAFVISNSLSATPFLIMITFISGTLCYFMVRLHPGFTHYLFFVLCLYASVTVVESLMMAIASVIPNFLMGIIIGAGIQVSCTFSRRIHITFSLPAPSDSLLHLMPYLIFKCFGLKICRGYSCSCRATSGSGRTSQSPSGVTRCRTSASTSGLFR